MQRLFLWDIDGTLIDSGGATKRAVRNAISTVLGIENVEHDVRFDGKTDPVIVEEVVAAIGHTPDETTIKRILRQMPKEAAKERSEIRRSGKTHPGVEQLLRALQKYKSVNTVLTGNVAANAVLKLDALGLIQLLDMEVGAYGNDRKIRYELVDVIFARVSKKYDALPPEKRIWVIGDTPADYEVAERNQLRCLLVASGGYSYDELASLGADAVLPDLSDVAKALEILTDGEPPPPPDPVIMDPW